MSAAAAAAALARQDANKLSVSELKKKFQEKNIDCSKCIEKSDLIALYVRTIGKEKHMPDIKNRPKRPKPTPTTRSPVRSTYTNNNNNNSSSRRTYTSGTEGSSLPKPTWQNAVMLFIFIMYVYKNYFEEQGSDFGGDVEYDGKGSVAYAKGDVVEITTHDQFRAALQQHKDDTGLPVVVDFFSHSCGPCRMIAPFYKKLAKQMKGQAVFLKIDVNRNYETSRACFVNAMPTFQFYLNGKKRHEFSGANQRGLQQATEQLAVEAKEKGVYVDMEVTEQALIDFYKEVDESKLESVKTIAAKYQSKTAKLMRMLKKKYDNKAPEAIPRTGDTPHARVNKEHQNPGADDAGNGGRSTTTDGNDDNNVYGEIDPSTGQVIFDITALPAMMLEDELARRREEREGDDMYFQDISVIKPMEKIVIIGGGPAGLSAAVYAARAGLEPLVIAPSFGGQLLGKGVDVENYPGVVGYDATGRGIITIMRRQANFFKTRMVPESIIKVKSMKDAAGEFELVLNDTKSTIVKAKSIIIATGASSRWLGVPGEYDLRGGGVSSCATCDGFLFRDRPVVVIGGGDTAMEDALVLARTSSKVTIIHRRDTFRASKILAKRVFAHDKIEIKWNTVVKSFDSKIHKESGKTVLTNVRVETVVDDLKTEESISCEGAFVAIGHDPNTKFLEGHLKMNEAGYLITDHESTQTSVDGVFAAGDVADHIYRQAVTSAGSGAMSALDAERYLSMNGVVA